MPLFDIQSSNRTVCHASVIKPISICDSIQDPYVIFRSGEEL